MTRRKRSFDRRTENSKKDKEKHADRRRRAREQEELQSGDVVWVKTSGKDEGDRVIVTEKREEPDSYNIQMRGKTLRRTRKHLRKRQISEPAEEGNNTGPVHSEKEERDTSYSESCGETERDDEANEKEVIDLKETDEEVIVENEA